MERKESNCYYEEDEIDLRELFRTIWGHRWFIVIFTGIVTLVAIVYAFLKTPVYKTKSIIQIGFIGKELVGDPETIAKRMQAVFHTEEGTFKSKEFKHNEACVESIKHNTEKEKDFIEVETYGIDNNTSIHKNKMVLKYLQREYAPKIEQYMLNTKNKIEQLKTQKENILKIYLPNLRTQIDLIKEQNLSNIDKQIEILKTQDLVRLKDKIYILRTQKIPSIQKNIIFYKKYKIKDITDKIKFYNEKLMQYNKAVNILYKQFGKESDTKVMIASIQMVNYQNLILDLQKRIKNLRLEKIKIAEEVIPKLEDQIKNIEDIDIKNLNFKIENILKVKIPNLEKEKIKIKAVKIKDIEDKIAITKNKITQINNQIKVLEFNMSPANVQNSKVVGGYIYNDYPAKPKKKLIIVVAFVTGLILSVFLVFFIEFIKSFKEEDDVK